MHPQATEADAQAYVHFAAAARELSMTPADFLAFFRRERHDLANCREGARQLGWSPLESAISFFRRMRAQD